MLCSRNPRFDNFTICNDQGIWNTTISLTTKEQISTIDLKVKNTHKIVLHSMRQYPTTPLIVEQQYIASRSGIHEKDSMQARKTLSPQGKKTEPLAA